MTDTVLQSFCERCGTRYTFTEQEQRPEGGLSALGRLVRRGPEPAPGEPTVSTMLPTSDHFEGTFHFCLECREYTCGDCWNAAAGYCVGCRPPGQAADPAGMERAASARTGVAPPAIRPGQPKTLVAPVTRGPQGPAHPTARRPDDARDTASKGGFPGARPEGDATLDEWGRPVKRTEPVDQAEGSKDHDTVVTRPELDPWRGVVFSAEEAQSAEKDADPSRTTSSPSESVAGPKATASAWPASDQRRTASTDPSAGAIAWPEADTRHRAEAKPSPAGRAPESAWPEEARREDEPGADDRLAEAADETQRHVEAASSARASASVAGTRRSTEPPGGGSEAPTDAVDESQPTEVHDVSLRFDDRAGSEARATITDSDALESVARDAQQTTETAPESEPAPDTEAAPHSGAARDTEAPVADASAGEAVAAPAGAEPEIVAATPSEPRPEIEAVPDVEPVATAEPDPTPAVEPGARPPLEPGEPPGKAEPADQAEPAGGMVGDPPPADRPVPHALAPLPTPPASQPPSSWGTDVASGPFSQPYAAPAPLQVPPPPSPGLPQPPGPMMIQGGPTPAPRQASASLQAEARGMPAGPHPGRVAPPPTPSLAAPAPAPLSGRGERTNTRACTSCALPLSAKARFCRRCGSPQA